MLTYTYFNIILNRSHPKVCSKVNFNLFERNWMIGTDKGQRKKWNKLIFQIATKLRWLCKRWSITNQPNYIFYMQLKYLMITACNTNGSRALFRTSCIYRLYSLLYIKYKHKEEIISSFSHWPSFHQCFLSRQLKVYKIYFESTFNFDWMYVCGMRCTRIFNR